MDSAQDNVVIILSEENGKEWELGLNKSVLELIDKNLIVKIIDKNYTLSERFLPFLTDFLLKEIESDEEAVAKKNLKDLLVSNAEQPLEILISIIKSEFIVHERKLRIKHSGYNYYEDTKSSLSMQNAAFLVNVYVQPYECLYNTNLFETQLSFFNKSKMVKLFSEHYKILVSKQKGELLKPTLNKDSSDMQTKIFDFIDAIDSKKGWKYIFKQEDQMKLFVSTLVSFFNNTEYSLPSETIPTNNRIKTRLAKVLHDIYFEFCKECLRSNINFLNIVEKLEAFNSLSSNEIYRSLTT